MFKKFFKKWYDHLVLTCFCNLARTKSLLDQPMKEVICFSEIGAKSTQIYKRFEEEDLHFVKLLHVYIQVRIHGYRNEKTKQNPLDCIVIMPHFGQTHQCFF